MLQEAETSRAHKDIINVLFELGILSSPDDYLDPEKSLRDDLGLDSQELISLVVSISALANNAAPLKEQHVASVQDCIKYLERNRDLWLPNDVDYVLQGSVRINQDMQTVFNYIADYKAWPEVLAHVTRIEPDIDDGRVQSFKMHIAELTTGEEYYVQSSRLVDSEKLTIDFLQPKPPAGFRVHKGGWRFNKIGPKETELVSFHGFSLDENTEADCGIGLIQKHIQAALRTWAAHGNV
ncbi:hypothetical protein C4K04_4754 [Pseudomonas chlororaphis]|uniref:Coenzyme Q-binding protein COQ10 START domain-containing protein n=1 Tax=Pseudomonas chlororaphis TaxID=587753 RepID=A0A3G7TVQ2_9PSED|nr:SRPBCC family protein [Pseudomonas chlororaphis]AZE50409.1 hypothetical protein C4K04_4754 [Pseudomonas chlororaphis]